MSVFARVNDERPERAGDPLPESFIAVDAAFSVFIDDPAMDYCVVLEAMALRAEARADEWLRLGYGGAAKDWHRQAARLRAKAEVRRAFLR